MTNLRSTPGVARSELHRVSNRDLARQEGMVNPGATILLHQAYIEIAGVQLRDLARYGLVRSRSDLFSLAAMRRVINCG